MTKKMLLYACLGLLCCGLGAWAVNLQIASQPINGMTDARGALTTNPADIMAMKTVRNGSATGHVAPAQTPAAAAVVATPAPHELTLQSALNPEASAAYSRWLATGTKTESEARLIESFLRPNYDSGRNPLDLTGGPDGVGYRFVDNQGGDTASFGWIELCGDPNASDGPTGDDNALQIFWGWNFPFYGTGYTSAFVTTNGRLTMTSFDASFGNSCIDGVTPFQPYIAPYWDDLYAAFNNGCDGSGAGPWIRYRDFGTHFVVQWQLSHFAGSDDNYAFEVILYPDGKIKYQYDADWNDSFTPNSATIGIDEPTAGNGLQYTCDGSGPGAQITGGRAVWFYQQPITGVDLRTSLLSPCVSAPPNATQTVSFRVTNFGLTTSSATTARFDWDGGTTLGSEAVPALTTGSFFDVFFTVTVDLTLGAHTLIGHVDVDALEAVADTSNNTSTCDVLGSLCQDNCAGVVPVPLPATFDCDNTGATHDCGLLGAGEGETWHAFTIDAACDVTLTQCGQAGNWGDFYIVLTSGCPCASLIFFSSYIFPDPNCPNGGIELHFDALPAGTYYYPVLRSDGFGAVGAYHIEVFCAPPCIVTPVGIAEPVEVQDESNTTLDANGGCNNDDCGGVNAWTVASCGGDYTGQTFYYVSPICGAGGTFRDTDWWELTITEPESIVVTVESENPGSDLVVFITDNNCATGPGTIAVGQQFNDCTPFSVGVPSCLNPGTYYIIVTPAFNTPVTGVTWDYNLHVECTPCTPCVPPANNDCANAVNVGVLGGAPLSFTGDNTCATEDCPSLSGGFYNDVWYEFTTTETCTLRVDFCGSTGTTGSANVYIVLETACPCPGFHYFADTWNTFDCGDGNWSVYFYDLPAGTYWYPVLGQTGAVFGPYTINFSNCGTVCDDVLDLRVYYNGVGVPHNGVNLYWSSPEDMQDTLRIFSTDSTDSDFDADNGADPDWELVTTVYQGDSVTNSGGFTTRSYHDTRGFVRYRKYNVVRQYCFTPPPPPPPCLADSCELNEITASDGVPLTVDNTCATTNPVWPCGAGGKDVWISYTATTTGTVTVSTCSGIGTLGDTVLEAWTDCPSGGGTAITCLDDFCGLRTEISFAGSAGVTYKIRLGGFGSGFGTAEVVITG